ncbi:cytochrome c biogenesis protein ResB [Microbacterium sp. KUDC0406]|uniref:cytochrome c biogenesis protein ResB n=1 Tax=Microbacterium sp. KUDC0406 TaxID=2909588 RepID=UPI001F341134|nr:cytochrome c biogenesis protein ResB [Microbacterium sp. KUDC0406]UJP08990.1 cytochrome c biogenesis protein ResB [Microbacterium sp. KUDC0406]
MSSSRSDVRAGASAETDPLRPADHIDSEAPGDDIAQPKLGFTGWLRWGWRQLTSMRVAIILLLVLAIAAIPGSIFPQRSADPNGVIKWKADNPDLFPVLDRLSLFDVYTSPWFSAIYLLLFLSLIGCIIPRIKHHLKALRAQPPRTPARLSRLDDHLERSWVPESVDGPDAPTGSATHDAGAGRAIDVAQKQLKALGYRVARYDRGTVRSVSAERGYLRETGNLVFHISLLGVLVAVGVGGGFAYTGQKVVIEGRNFVNILTDYDSINRGRFVGDDALQPYRMTLDSFDIAYQPPGTAGAGQAGDFSANVTVTEADDSEHKGAVRVNHPLGIGADKVYLLGNGYAPSITVRNAEGEVVTSGPVAFLPQDNNMTSLGVLKVPDGMPEQMALTGFFYPTAGKLSTGAYTSAYPDLYGPLLTLDVYVGDLGIDDGTPQSVYVLDTNPMDKLTGRGTDVKSIELEPGKTAELPNGMGTVTFEDESPAGAKDFTKSVKRYVSLQIHHDESAVWVLVFAVLALVGLALALFVPRRRMWVKATPRDDGVTLEYAGLARGEDPTLASAVDDLASGHERLLDGSAPRHSESRKTPTAPEEG